MPCILVPGALEAVYAVVLGTQVLTLLVEVVAEAVERKRVGN